MKPSFLRNFGENTSPGRLNSILKVRYEVDMEVKSKTL